MKHLRNDKGMATIETLPLIMVFVFLICYEFGVFGIIHTGVMQSISARAYAFETFKYRSSLVYFRDDPVPKSLNVFRNGNEPTKGGSRTHGIASELRDNNDGTADGVAAERPLRVGIPFDPDLATRADTAVHNTKVFDQNLVGRQKRNQSVNVNPVWIQVQYGMCLNTYCGGEN